MTRQRQLSYCYKMQKDAYLGTNRREVQNRFCGNGQTMRLSDDIVVTHAAAANKYSFSPVYLARSRRG